MHDYKKVLEIINQNTFIENVNKGVVQPPDFFGATKSEGRSEEHTSELQSQSTISYAVFCLQKKKKTKHTMLAI